MNNLMKFESQDIEIIADENGEPLFELYSTGMTLGHVKTAKGTKYPRKDRVDAVCKRLGFEPVVKNGQPHLNESQVYDFMLETKISNCIPFRKWVTSEVISQIRKTGGYIPIVPEETDADIMAKAFIITNNTIALRDKKFKETATEVILFNVTLTVQNPKSDYYDELIARGHPLVHINLCIHKNYI